MTADIAVFIDTRALLLPPDRGREFDRFQAAVLMESGGLREYTNPATDEPALVHVGPLHDRAAMLEEALGDVRLYLVGPDRAALSILGDYMNFVRGSFLADDDSGRSAGQTVALACAGMRDFPQLVVIITPENLATELRATVQDLLPRPRVEVVTCGPLGVLAHEAAVAGECVLNFTLEGGGL